MYGSAGDRASPTWGRIGKKVCSVSANCAKINAFSAPCLSRDRPPGERSGFLPRNPRYHCGPWSGIGECRQANPEPERREESKGLRLARNM